jgi:hypothetical protein
MKLINTIDEMKDKIKQLEAQVADLKARQCLTCIHENPDSVSCKRTFLRPVDYKHLTYACNFWEPNKQGE